MKIGVLTFHFPYNCGAALQCYALTRFLQQKGAEVEVINYRPWYHQNRYTLFRNPMQAAKEEYNRCKKNGKQRIAFIRGARWYLGTIRSWLEYKSVLEKDSKFKNFVKKYFKETRVYRTLEQLQKKPPKCDLYICGSDQVWNTDITGEMIDNAYFLDFGKPGVGKYTYAVSANLLTCEQEEEKLKELLSGLQTISLREDVWTEQIQKLCEGKQKTRIDVDPVFLLDKDEYNQIMADRPLKKEPFIAVYVIPDDTVENVFKVAQKLAAQKGLDIVDMSCVKNKGVPCGVEEFLWYIGNAEYVITNSFHGTAFSIIMEKKFVSIPFLSTGFRMVQLLKDLNMSECLTYDEEEALRRIERDLPYEAIRERVRAYKESSQHYLEKISGSLQ